MRRPRRGVPVATQYIQLTNFADSATSPALSPDGRMLTFIRGPSTFFSPGQVYVKRLPDGEPVQLTNDNTEKMGPQFLPDGTRISYSTGIGADSPSMDTWVVSVDGGPPQRLLTNAEGTDLVQRSSRSAASPVFRDDRTGRADVDRVRRRSVGPHRKTSMFRHRRTAWRIARIAHPTGSGSWSSRWTTSRGCRAGWYPFDGSSTGKPVGPAAVAVHGCRLVAGWNVDVFHRDDRERRSHLAATLS